MKKKLKPYFRELTKLAHSYGAKIHGLGFTQLKNLPSYGFDSVDSTSWMRGNLGGFCYKFDGVTIQHVKKARNQKLNTGNVAINNFKEWVKFAEFLEEKHG